MKQLGRFVLDTLQLFFPWDDDFYTYASRNGFGKGGFGGKPI